MASRAATLAEPMRRRMAGEVRRLFHDPVRGDRPVEPSDNALVARDSVAWRVHGDVTSMMVGGIAALLLQMLHPAALAGVWDHSNFKADMIGRLRRTSRFIAMTTYAERGEAEAAIARVRSIHGQIRGTLPGGSGYAASDPRLLAFVHVAGALCFLDAFMRFIDPRLSDADQDSYFREVAGVAEALGAVPVPRSRQEAEALLASFTPELRSDRRSRAVRDIILAPKSSLALLPVDRLLTRSAIDLLPDFARRMHGLRRSRLGRPAYLAATAGLGRTLRWALARN